MPAGISYTFFGNKRLLRLETLEKLDARKFIYSEYPSQPAITCSRLTIETLEQGVKYVQS